MSRSLWKGPFVEKSILKKLMVFRIKNQSSGTVKTWSRSSTVCPSFVNYRFRVHNGKEFFPVLVTSEMVGHKLGEFVPTRARYEFKKKKKKK